MLKEVFKKVAELFPKAKFYEDETLIQNGLYIVFEGVSFEMSQANYAFKLLVAGNSLNKDSQSVLAQCDELVKTIEQNKENCLENHPSKMNIKQLRRVNVREGLFCYELSFDLVLRLLRGV